MNFLPAQEMTRVEPGSVAIDSLRTLLKLVTEMCIVHGADFVKTSTGKVKVNATLEASELMLSEIKKAHENRTRMVGFKASGGISAVDDVAEYLWLAKKLLGDSYLVPKYFRFGASKLLQSVYGVIETRGLTAGGLEATQHDFRGDAGKFRHV